MWARLRGMVSVFSGYMSGISKLGLKSLRWSHSSVWHLSWGGLVTGAWLGLLGFSLLVGFLLDLGAYFSVFFLFHQSSVSFTKISLHLNSLFSKKFPSEQNQKVQSTYRIGHRNPSFSLLPKCHFWSKLSHKTSPGSSEKE
jgi:hypothetical protein